MAALKEHDEFADKKQNKGKPKNKEKRQ